MDPNKTPAIESNGDSRRDFLKKTLATASGLALAQSLGAPLVKAQAGSPAFVNPSEVARRSTGVLRAVVQISETTRSVPNVAPSVMRYFQGWDPADAAKKAPANPAVAGPGPTLRAEVGDKVQITFLNKTDDSKFPYTIDTAPADKDKAGFGCDASGTDYPVDDIFPNCFHGSSTANMHFHGTHTNPDGLGDNVLVQILPQTKQEDWDRFFENNIFNKPIPPLWNAMPTHYRTEQEKLIKAIDTENERQAVKANRVPPEKMWPTDEHQIHQGVWPQYLAGAFPNYFEITKYTPGNTHPLGVPGATQPVAGQAPGTHWYHAHKHGSTALHILSGLAGAFIIEDNSPTGYDGALKAFYGPDFVQNVLVVQMFNPQQNLERGSHVAPGQLVNGQLKPTIAMKPNEVQLWRVVNATVGGNQGTIGSTVFSGLTAAGFQIKQIAQDGVQFRWENFDTQPYLTNAVPGGMTVAAGNRVDLLVIAPSAPTATPVAAGTLLFVNVGGTAVAAKGFIGKAHYPAFPEYLENLAAPKTTPHQVVFGWAEGTTGPGRTQGVPPHFQIDGKQFEQNGPVIDQCMELGTTEDWVLENHTTVPHPFHIHINPFQVMQIDAPAANTGTVVPYVAKYPVWQDVVNLPPGVQVTGGAFVPGKVHIRHRFVDFVGTYVLHCHILAHEDRGMMQLVRVVTPENYKKGCQIDIPMHH